MQRLWAILTYRQLVLSIETRRFDMAAVSKHDIVWFVPYYVTKDGNTTFVTQIYDLSKDCKLLTLFSCSTKKNSKWFDKESVSMHSALLLVMYNTAFITQSYDLINHQVGEESKLLESILQRYRNMSPLNHV